MQTQATNPLTCDAGVRFLDIYESFGIQLTHPTLEMRYSFIWKNEMLKFMLKMDMD